MKKLDKKVVFIYNNKLYLDKNVVFIYSNKLYYEIKQSFCGKLYIILIK